MPVVGGLTKNRSHTLGIQTAIGTPVAATRRVPFTGAIVVDPQWTDVEADVGAIDLILPPTRRGNEVTGSWEDNALTYNDATIFWGSMDGETTPSGSTSFLWTINPTSGNQDPFHLWTDEWYDDVTTDVIRGVGGIINDFTITWPDDMGPLTASASLMYAKADVGSPTTPTAPTTGKAVSAQDVVIYATDTEFYINSTFATLGTTKLTDTFHGGSIHVTTEIDEKRFANGSNTRFDVRGFARASRTIEAEFRFAKQASVIAEVANLLGSTPTTRYVQLKTTSPEIIASGVHYQQQISLVGDWRARSDDTIGGNDIIVLSMKARFTGDISVLQVLLFNKLPTIAADTSL